MTRFQLGGMRFRQIDVERSNERSHDDDFLIMKNDAILRFYESLRPHLPKTIMEIGMFEGGSLVYFDKLFRPTKLVGVDRRREPIPALEEYRKSHPHIETYYARFQDKAGVLQAAKRNFPDGIDLVVDDASHLYAESKATFGMLFPLIRNGGHYVIERWCSQEWAMQNDISLENGRPGLVGKFVHELIEQLPQSLDIECVNVHTEAVCVRKSGRT